MDQEQKNLHEPLEQQGDNDLCLPWLLIAAPQLNDPHFKRAVVIIVEHNDEGSMGFVLNRPLDTPLAQVIDFPETTIPDNIPVWYGGPVATENGVIIHSRLDQQLCERSPAQIVMSASDECLHSLINHATDMSEALDQQHKLSTDPRPGAESALNIEHPLVNGMDLYTYRFIVGYSGWGAGQLEEEIREGFWLQVPSTQELVFRSPWNRMWEDAYASLGVAPQGFAPGVNDFLN